MKIGILYICTGKYDIFWKDFYSSCEKYFIPEAEKHYFVFTDASKIEFENENKNITKIYQENLGWPGNTLKRYEMFLKTKEKIESTDYVFFFNANTVFLKLITEQEFLPTNSEKLVACIHPGFYNAPRQKFTYDRNPRSLAYIPKGSGNYYFAGGINGGITKDFLEAIEEMNKNIQIDLKNNTIAKWHDESHWNKYLLNRTYIKRMPPAYLYPEDSHIPFSPKILLVNKEKHGGGFFMRGQKISLIKKGILLTKKILAKILK